MQDSECSEDELMRKGLTELRESLNQLPVNNDVDDDLPNYRKSVESVDSLIGGNLYKGPIFTASESFTNDVNLLTHLSPTDNGKAVARPVRLKATVSMANGVKERRRREERRVDEILAMKLMDTQERDEFDDEVEQEDFELGGQNATPGFLALQENALVKVSRFQKVCRALKLSKINRLFEHASKQIPKQHKDTKAPVLPNNAVVASYDDEVEVELKNDIGVPRRGIRHMNWDSLYGLFDEKKRDSGINGVVNSRSSYVKGNVSLSTTFILHITFLHKYSFRVFFIGYQSRK